MHGERTAAGHARYDRLSFLKCTRGVRAPEAGGRERRGRLARVFRALGVAPRCTGRGSLPVGLRLCGREPGLGRSGSDGLTNSNHAVETPCRGACRSLVEPAVHSNATRNQSSCRPRSPQLSPSRMSGPSPPVYVPVRRPRPSLSSNSVASPLPRGHVDLLRTRISTVVSREFCPGNLGAVRLSQ